MYQELSAGEVILKKYHVLSSLGSGGGGTVYLCRNDEGAQVALKQLFGGRRSAELEYQALTRLEHRNIVKVLDAGIEDNHAFLILEYVPGGTNLREYLNQSGRPGQDARMKRLFKLIPQVLSALDYLHSRGVVHGDLKPHNILIAPQGIPKIADFGLAQIDAPNIAITDRGSFAGTVQYASPEQFRGANPDTRSDLYSLGIILYEAFTGYLPFQGQSFYDIMIKHNEERPQPPSLLFSSIPKFVEQIIMLLLEKKPCERLPSAREVMKIFSRHAEEHPSLTAKAQHLNPVLFAPAFAGRSQELKTIADLLRITDEDSTPGTKNILIKGQEGIGKTRFIQQLELIKAWEGILFCPIRIQGQSGLSLNEALVEFRGRALDFRNRSSEEVRDRIKKGISASISMIPGWDVFTDDQASDAPFYTSFCRLLSNLSAIVPVVLICDNISSISPSIAEFILHLKGIPGRITLIGILDTNAEDLKTESAGRVLELFAEAGTISELEPMSDDLIRLIIRSVLGSIDVPERLLDRIVLSCGGNPGLSQELLRIALETGSLQYQDGNWYFVSSKWAAHPASFPQRLLSRYELLSTDLKDLLETMAVAYPIDAFTIIRKAVRTESQNLIHHIETLVNKGFIGLSGGTLKFQQPILIDLLVRELPPDRRRQIHDRISEILPAEPGAIDITLLAHHLSHGSRPSQALQYYLDIFLQYQQHGRFTEIADILEFAVGIEPLTEEDYGILRKLWRYLGVAYRETGNLSGAQKAYSKLAQLAVDHNDQEAEINALYGLAGILYSTGKIPEALRYFQRSAELCRQIGNPNLEGRIRLGAGVCYSSINRYAEAIDEAKTAGLIFEKLKHPNSLARTYQLLGDSHHELGRFAEARQYHEKALSIFESENQLTPQATCLGSIGRSYLDQGYFEEAESYLQKSLELIKQAKNPMIENLVRINLGRCLVLKGEPYRAIRELEEAVTQIQKLGFPKSISDGYRNLAFAHTQTGDLKTARAEYRKALEIYRAQNDLHGEYECLLSIAEMNLTIGKWDDSFHLLMDLKEKSRDKRYWILYADVLLNLSTVFQMKNDLESARKHAGHALKINRKLDRLHKIGILQCQLGFISLDTKDTRTAFSYFKESHDTFRTCGLKNWDLRALQGLYEAALETGNKDQAEQYARQMNETFKEIDYHAAISHIFFRQSPHNLSHPLGTAGLQLADRIVKSGLFVKSLVHQYAQSWTEKTVQIHPPDHPNREEEVTPEPQIDNHGFPEPEREASMQVHDMAPIHFLLKSSRQLFSANDLDRLLTLVIDQVVDTARAERAFLMMREASGELRFRISRNMKQEDVLRPEFETSRSIIDHVSKKGQTYMSADVATDEDFKYQKSIQLLGSRSVLCVPIPDPGSDTAISGLIYMDSSIQKNLFTPSDRLLTEIIAGLTSIAYGHVREKIDLTATNQALDEEINKLKEELGQRYRFGSLVGRSQAMMKIFEMIERVAKSSASILVTGETGTGKEIVAKTIHFNSPRKDRAFIGINCAAIPENLLEAELFGIEKGVATGVDARVGLIQKASGGTLFLDEIADMNPPIQAKLLRVLQEREVTPLGGRTPKKVDIRVISATNRDIKQELQQGRFREDLYYRLNVIHIHLPPIRDRLEDIVPLGKFFLDRYAKESGSKIKGFAQDALNAMAGYRWPGNVRELENAIQHAVIMESGTKISADSLPPEIGNRPPSQLPPEVISLSENLNLKWNLDRIEIQLIEKALGKASGLKKEAATLLGLTPRIMSYYLKKHGISVRGKQSK